MYKFLILVTTIRTFSIYVSKDVRIRGYFSKRQGAREQKSLGNTGIRPFVWKCSFLCRSFWNIFA